MAMGTLRVYSYLRFSTDIQSRGDSIRRQTQLARDYRDTNGLELDESLTFHDLRVSAFKGANAATGKLGLFLKSFEQGKVKQGIYYYTSNKTSGRQAGSTRPDHRI